MIVNIGFTTAEIAAMNLSEGDIIYNKDNNTLYSYNGVSLIPAESSNVISGTTTFDFGGESDMVVSTIANLDITSVAVKSFVAIPTDTTATSLDDFSLNGLTFNLENIINNTSFDIRATAINNASGIYTVTYKIVQ